MNPTKPLERQLKKALPRRALRRLRLKPAVVTLGVFAGIMAVGYLVPALVVGIMGFGQPTIPIAGEGVQIYDRFNNPVCIIYGERDQQVVHLKQVSPFVPQAFMAAEDHDFYHHAGINPIAIVRAVLVDITHGHAIQGGSTITQQLVKNVYFEGKKRGIAEKISEAFLALDIEHRYNKQQILEAYLNCVYFGRGVYGIERASEQYFGKNASKLSVPEAAFLAGLVTAPSDLGRPDNRKAAIKRQQLTLNSMAELHFITADQASAAKKQKLAFRSFINPARKYTQYTQEVVDYVRKQLNVEDPYSQGYRVYTNMDAGAQEAAERVMSSGIKAAPRGINQGALVSINVADGGIMAMVGGVGPHAEWNRATSPHTAGSAFKPFVYLAALAKGTLTPDSTIEDAPIELNQGNGQMWRPQNFEHDYMGTITIRKAIALSRNTCAVRAALGVGPHEVANFARAAGITSKLDENMSIALGSSAVSPLDMANAYSTLARDGEWVQPLMVRKIADRNGKTLKEYSQERKRVFDTEPVAELVDAMEDVVQRGTGTRARLFDRPVAGKTGTADGGKDVWFVGFTPDMVTAVWGGNDDNKAVVAPVSGGSVMAGIWHNYMSNYYAQHRVAVGAFTEPQHPLLAEDEDLHIWPAPSPAINNFFGGWFNVPQAPSVRDYEWAPRRYSDEDEAQERRHDVQEQRREQAAAHHQSSKPKKKKGIFRKLMNFFDGF